MNPATLKDDLPTLENRTRQWIKRAQEGDILARNDILQSRLRLVVHLAKRYHRPDSFIELSDLVQQGCLGLIKAIERFDLRRKARRHHVKFNTFAGYPIREAMLREIDNHGRTIAVPVNILAYERYTARNTLRAQSETVKVLGWEKLHKQFGLTRRSVARLEQTAQQVVPLEISWQGDEPFERTLPCKPPDPTDPEPLFAQTEYSQNLQKLLTALPERERFVIEEHFGLLDAGAPKTLKTIGRRLGVGRERARQIELRAFRIMRAAAGPQFLCG